MNERNTSFEVQVLRDKRWVVEDIKTDEAQAKAFAENLLQKGNLDAVRVVRDYQRLDGMHKETVVLEKQGDGKTKAEITLSTVTEAPLCQAPEDFFGLSARLTMGRLMRRYLDEVVITPTELLHSAAEMKRFADKDRLLYSAVDAISGLQTRQFGGEIKERRDFLYKAWDEAYSRARSVGPEKMPADKSFGQLTKLAMPGPQHDFHLGTLMAKVLLDTRSWFGKLDTLIGWAGEPAAAKELFRIDGVVADIVVSAQFMQDLLGFQNNLGAALMQICDLGEGKAQPTKFAPNCFATLNQMFGANRLPDARQVLLQRVIREIKAGSPLARNQPNLEYEMFHKLAHRLVSEAKVTGGPAAAAALLSRYAQVVQLQGGDQATQAMDGLSQALANGCRRIQLLVALGQAPVAADLPWLERLGDVIGDAQGLAGLISTRENPRERMAAVTGAHGSLMASPSIPAAKRKELGDKLDTMLARYLVDEAVIEKIDKADDPLAMRAIRLIKFCGSGVLIAGKSLDLAKGRVLEHLRQPQFEAKFLASVPDPVQAERHLREFHRILVESGFAG
jgi:hypothetical protein